MISKLLELGAVRFNQIAVPLVIYPYILTKIGLEQVGFIAFWVGLSAFLSKLASLNMETLSTRLVTLAVSRYEVRKRILLPLYIKSVLGVVFFSVYLIFSFLYVDDSRLFLTALFCGYPIIKASLSMNHYFVGIGNFRVMLISSVIENIFLIFMVFITVHGPEDALFYPLSYFISSLVAFPVTLRLANVSDFTLPFKVIKKEMRRYLNSAKWLFFGKSFQLHLNAAKPILGLFFGYSVVGIFDISQKIINVLKIPFSVFSDAFYSSDMKDKKSIVLAVLYGFILSLALYCSVIFLAPYLISIFSLDIDLLYFRKVFYISGLVLFITPLNLIFGVNYVSKYLEESYYGKVLFFSSLLSVVLLLLWMLFFKSSFFMFLWWTFCTELIFFTFCIFTIYKHIRGTAVEV